MDLINKLDSLVSNEKRLSDNAKRRYMTVEGHDMVVRDQGRKHAIFVYIMSCNYL